MQHTCTNSLHGDIVEKILSLKIKESEIKAVIINKFSRGILKFENIKSVESISLLQARRCQAPVEVHMAGLSQPH